MEAKYGHETLEQALKPPSYDSLGVLVLKNTQERRVRVTTERSFFKSLNGEEG